MNCFLNSHEPDSESDGRIESVYKKPVSKHKTGTNFYVGFKVVVQKILILLQKYIGLPSSRRLSLESL